MILTLESVGVNYTSDHSISCDVVCLLLVCLFVSKISVNCVNTCKLVGESHTLQLSVFPQ